MHSDPSANLHVLTVQGFGEEWTAFDQTDLPPAEARAHFDSYFACFRWNLVDSQSTGFDMGCGSGRWAKLLAPHVGHLHCIDPSSALEVAKRVPRIGVTSLIAALVYPPLARLAKLLTAAGVDMKRLSLSFCRNTNYYMMCTGALSRFGTRLAQRFTCKEIAAMLEAAGRDDIRFSKKMSYCCVCAVRNG